MYGGEGLGDYVPMAALRSTLPKESERELVLAAEQQQLEEEEVRDKCCASTVLLYSLLVNLNLAPLRLCVLLLYTTPVNTCILCIDRSTHA